MAAAAERIAAEIGELKNEKEEVKRQAQAAPEGIDLQLIHLQRLAALDQRLAALQQRLHGAEQDQRELRWQQQQGGMGPWQQAFFGWLLEPPPLWPPPGWEGLGSRRQPHSRQEEGTGMWHGLLEVLGLRQPPGWRAGSSKQPYSRYEGDAKVE